MSIFDFHSVLIYRGIFRMLTVETGDRLSCFFNSESKDVVHIVHGHQQYEWRASYDVEMIKILTYNSLRYIILKLRDNEGCVIIEAIEVEIDEESNVLANGSVKIQCIMTSETQLTKRQKLNESMLRFNQPHDPICVPVVVKQTSENFEERHYLLMRDQMNMIQLLSIELEERNKIVIGRTSCQCITSQFFTSAIGFQQSNSQIFIFGITDTERLIFVTPSGHSTVINKGLFYQ